MLHISGSVALATAICSDIKPNTENTENRILYFQES